jgi:hypothetical protein
MKNSDPTKFSLGSVHQDGGITYIVFKDSKAHELADARSLMEAIREVASRTDPLPMLTDVRSTSVGPSKDARNFYDAPENAGYASCSALLCASAYQKILGNFAFMFTPHEMPTRIFTDEVAALAWLEEHRGD